MELSSPPMTPPLCPGMLRSPPDAAPPAALAPVTVAAAARPPAPPAAIRVLVPSLHVVVPPVPRSEEHTSELQSLMRISYAVFCSKKKIDNKYTKAYRYRT